MLPALRILTQWNAETDKTNTKLLLTLLFSGTLMGALDLAIIGPAIPALQAEFDLRRPRPGEPD